MGFQNKTYEDIFSDRPCPTQLSMSSSESKTSRSDSVSSGSAGQKVKEDGSQRILYIQVNIHPH